MSKTWSLDIRIGESWCIRHWGDLGERCKQTITEKCLENIDLVVSGDGNLNH